MLSMVAVITQKSGQCRRQLSIDDEPHNLLSEEHRMIHLGGGILQTSVDIIILQIRKIFEYFLSWDVRGEEIEDIPHPDPHSSDAGSATALIGIEGDSLVHGGRVAHWCG